MFILSTSWNSARHNNGSDMINEIKKVGFDAVELSFALSKGMVDEILNMSNNGAISVSSLHNMCPLPDDIRRAEASPDYYSLSSLNEDERALALNAAKQTISYAKKFGSRAVVLHAGRIPLKDKTRELAGSINDQNKFDSLRSEMIRDRQKSAKAYFESTLKSLQELVTYSKELGIALAIENRYYYREIPSFDEFVEIFTTFKSGDLYYWHDVGHSEVFERLGLIHKGSLLDKFANRLIGIHLHDIIGPMNDHRPPGQGSVDFSMFKRHIRKDTLKVIEAHQPSTAIQIAESVQYLKRCMGDE